MAYSKTLLFYLYFVLMPNFIFFNFENGFVLEKKIIRRNIVGKLISLFTIIYYRQYLIFHTIQRKYGVGCTVSIHKFTYTSAILIRIIIFLICFCQKCLDFSKWYNTTDVNICKFWNSKSWYFKFRQPIGGLLVVSLKYFYWISYESFMGILVYFNLLCQQLSVINLRHLL